MKDLTPARIEVNIDHLATAFNEWARRYADNPDEFGEILGDDGRPVADYGQRCAVYLSRLLVELSATKKPYIGTGAGDAQAS